IEKISGGVLVSQPETGNLILIDQNQSVKLFAEYFFADKILRAGENSVWLLDVVSNEIVQLNTRQKVIIGTISVIDFNIIDFSVIRGQGTDGLGQLFALDVDQKGNSRNIYQYNFSRQRFERIFESRQSISTFVALQGGFLAALKDAEGTIAWFEDRDKRTTLVTGFQKVNELQIVDQTVANGRTL